MIEKQPFGRTGHVSTRTIFGAAALGGVTQAEANRTLDVLLEYGINHIDTAASYGDSELRIGPWGEKPQNRATWYEPLEAQADIDRAVHWVLSRPNIFLNTAGDIHLLPKVLDAARRFQSQQPSEAEMQAEVERLEMTPLFI